MEVYKLTVLENKDNMDNKDDTLLEMNHCYINSDYYAFALPVAQSKALDYTIIKESKYSCDEIYNEVIY